MFSKRTSQLLFILGLAVTLSACGPEGTRTPIVASPNNNQLGYVHPHNVPNHPGFPPRSPQPSPAFDTFDIYTALAPFGSWIEINGVHFFSPLVQSPDWQPYMHGQWVWVNGQGVTWSSFDPWGPITDHYGVWRYHYQFGWLWRPVLDRLGHPVYAPHRVTFFWGTDFTGWLPFNNTFTYEFGWSHGFRDGFDIAAWSYYGTQQSHPYTPGMVAVSRGQFISNNVFDVHVNITQCQTWWRQSYSHHAWSVHIGARSSLREERSFIQTRLGMNVQIPVRQVVITHPHQGERMHRLKRVRPLPARYNRQVNHRKRKAPVRRAQPQRRTQPRRAQPQKPQKAPSTFGVPQTPNKPIFGVTSSKKKQKRRSRPAKRVQKRKSFGVTR